MGAGGGREQQRAVGNRLLHRIEQLDVLEDVIGARGGALRADIRPTIARFDNTQPAQGEIAHRSRGHADILPELRLDENDDGSGKLDA